MLLVTALGSISGGVFSHGVFFLTREHYRFSADENLVLALFVGLAYAGLARSAGGLTARLAPARPRWLVAACFVVWALAAALPVFWSTRVTIWVCAVVGAGLGGMIWPIVESFLGGGRHGSALRGVLGPFNLTWTLATAAPLLVLSPLSELHGLAPLALCAGTNGLAALALTLFPNRPADAHPDHADSSLGREYPALLRASSWLLPLSYLLSSTLSPILPHRLAALGTTTSAAAVAAIWMMTRFATLGAMTLLPFWHGRWGALVAGGAALMGGVAFTLLGDSLATVAFGLALFGVGMGLTYFCAIYYSLAVGHAAVDAGGGFEALIGLGYILGPLVGMAGRALPLGSSGGTGTVAIAWTMSLAGSALAVRPYLAARRARSAAG